MLSPFVLFGYLLRLVATIMFSFAGYRLLSLSPRAGFLWLCI